MVLFHYPDAMLLSFLQKLLEPLRIILIIKSGDVVARPVPVVPGPRNEVGKTLVRRARYSDPHAALIAHHHLGHRQLR